MEKANINIKKTKDLNYDLMAAYSTAVKNPEFKKLINTLKIKEDMACKYTSKLEKTVNDLNNCSKCKGLNNCLNEVEGMVYYPTVNGNRLDFNYVACKYKKKDIKEKEAVKSKFFEMPYEIRIARMADIDATDAKRIKIIKYLDNFYESYKNGKYLKGLYLHGSFGSGKTYLISALLNELSSLNFSTIIIYYPELLRSLKESFGNDEFSQRMDEIKKSNLLLLDDIGAETVTTWNRDEILGTILQYRMDNKLPTFFTSNLTMQELESHFTLKNDAEELIKSKRIMERINQLSEDLELISQNRRK